MKAPFSAYLDSLRDGLRELIALLRPDYDYVSVLATDSRGLSVRISQRARSVSSETMTTERGVNVELFGRYERCPAYRADRPLMRVP